MNFYIKEWPNKSATLMTDDGIVLWTFSSVTEARKVWHDWRKLQQGNTSFNINKLGSHQLCNNDLCNA